MELAAAKTQGAMKQRRQTFSLKDTIETSVGNGIDEQITALERQIATAITEIASTIEEKYTDCIPSLCISNRLLESIHLACKSAQNTIDQIADDVKRVEETIASREQALSRLAVVEDCKAKMACLEEIESLLSQLWYSSNDENPLVNARLIINLEEKLANIIEDVVDSEEIFTERICPALKREIISLRQSLTYMLDTFWDQMFIFQEVDGNGVSLQIPSASSGAISEKFSAMDVLSILDVKLTKLSSSLMKYFCEPIVVAHDPSTAFIYRGATAVVDVKHEYVIRCNTKANNYEHAAGQTEDRRVVFKSLSDFFKCFFKDIGSIDVNGSSLVQLIGNKMSGDMIEMIVHKCLIPAVPYDSEDMSNFDALTAASEQFADELKEMGFLTSLHSFKSFAENYENTFINRRCTKFMVEARSLIEAPLTEFTTVGSVEDTEEEAVEEFKKLGLCAAEMKSGANEHCPKLLQLSKCEVSKTAKQFADVIVSTLNAASEAECEVATAKLLETSRNLVQLYLIIAPRYHDSEISSVPLLAAVFYNNCYYICHRLMAIGIDVIPKVQKSIETKNLRITFADFIPKLRDLAACSMEKQLAQCRRQISSLLIDNKIFVELDNSSRYSACFKSLNGCMLHLKQISGIWKNVLTETVYANCMSNLVSFFLSTLVKFLMSEEDIRAKDAEIASTMLNDVFRDVEQIFIVGKANRSCVYQFVKSPLFRIKELVFCLEASLQEIYDRWCDGKGPLAQWLSANEVRHLVKALFQNTEKRAYVLSKIN